MSSTPTSESSTKVGSDSSITFEEPKSLRYRTFERAHRATTAQDILLFLVAFRILNALSIRTFFQPDEYFQSLEPAWQIAFGKDSGAWITWEWKNQLRSAIHPSIFAGVYWLASWLSTSLKLPTTWRADLLVAAPKVTQAVFAALGDYYTWRLASKTYGHESKEAWAALLLTICSPWQWFCSTRTLSNCLETTLTIIALNSWPWHWVLDKSGEEQEDRYGLRRDHEGDEQNQELAKLCCCLLLAALACILRPTNLLIWICFACFMLWRTASFGWLVPFRRPEAPIWIHISSWTIGPATSKERKVLVAEAVLCGALVFALSTIVDRVYYQQWTLPPLRFLYFNIAQSLAVFYGRNPWHYYLTQGYPLLLTTFLPFGLISLYQSLSSGSDTNFSPLSRKITYQLATTAVVVPAILSLISHKEVRFIYPLLPLLHVLSAPSFVSFFHPCITPVSPRQYHALLPRRLLLVCLALATLALSLLTTTSHQTAPLSVMNYLRSQYTSHYLTQPPSASALTPAPSIMTVGFLMPCHSTPWRSHLVFSGIKAWALGCEPPVGLNATEREHYLDEADHFYADPIQFLNHELGKAPQAKRSGFLGFGRQEGGSFPSDQVQQPGEIEPWDGKLGRKQWPDYVAFFGQLEPTMQTVLKGSRYRECWRGWNSWGHDDSRRKGDIVVWCVRDREKKREKREKEKLRKGWW